MSPQVACPECISLIKNMLKAKSAVLYHHSVLTAEITQQIASDLSVPAFSPEQAYLAGLVHDVGKLSVPDMTLEKKGSLDDREWETIRLHPVWGYQFVQNIEPLKVYAEIILCHHEVPSGKGYPFGRTDVPFEARLVSVADRVSALLDDRSYRRRITHFQYLSKEIASIVADHFPQGHSGIEKSLADILVRNIGKAECASPLVGCEKKRNRLLNCVVVDDAGMDDSSAKEMAGFAFLGATGTGGR